MTKTPPHRIGRRYKNITNTCQNCREEFHPKLGMKDQKYCQRSCYEAARASTYVTKRCPQCLKDFTVKAIYDDRYTVCSRACRLAETVYVDCKRCGKTFTGERSRPRSYCSEICRRPPLMTTCRNCKKTFRAVPTSNRIFCAAYCYRAYNGETRTEEVVRLALDQLGVAYEQELKVGTYRLDFAVTKDKIDIEVDGVYWHDPLEDRRRDNKLAHYGWRTIRITDKEIAVCEDLPALLKARIEMLLDRDVA